MNLLSLFQVQRRKHLSKVLYTKCATVLFETALASYTIWLLVKGPNLSFEWKSYIEVTLFFMYLVKLVYYLYYD